MRVPVQLGGARRVRPRDGLPRTDRHRRSRAARSRVVRPAASAVTNRVAEQFQREAGVSWTPPTCVADVDVLPSRLAVTELALGAVETAAKSAAVLSRARGGPAPDVVVDGRRVSAAFRSDRLTSRDGRVFEGFSDLSRFWRTSDGWVRTHGNYPHHRRRLLTALDLPPDAGSTMLRRCSRRCARSRSKTP